jgi:hypothetical protein
VGEGLQYALFKDILSGAASILAGDGDYAARTALGADGRAIYLTGYQAGMSAEEQMFLAVVLGHEAYRDGIVTVNNYLETRGAVQGHTQMAMRMLYDGQKIAMNEGLVNDIIAYTYGDQAMFDAYVDYYYDSSDDYYRMYNDIDGKVTRILDDGDYNNVTKVDADGSERTVKLQLQGGSINAALAAAAGNGMTQYQVGNLLYISRQADGLINSLRTEPTPGERQGERQVYLDVSTRRDLVDNGWVYISRDQQARNDAAFNIKEKCFDDSLYDHWEVRVDTRITPPFTESMERETAEGERHLGPVLVYCNIQT